MAFCPAHDDRNASLSVHVSDGRILLHCNAGCSTEDVVNALGLTMSDLFVESKKTRPKIVASYPYPDERGNVLFEVVRFDPKAFKQRKPDGRGGWLWNLNGVRHVLYNLPEVIRASDVLILEGEKDCETGRRLGFVATCNRSGAGKWRAEYSEHLRHRRVVIIPDRDEAGRKHARDVARSLRLHQSPLRPRKSPTK